MLKELRAAESNEGPFARYLDDAIYLESYRIASGVRANRRKADLLVRIAALGYWNFFQIRQIAKFVITTPEMPVPTFRITAWQVASARFSLAFGIFLMAMGGILAFSVMLKGAALGSVCAIFAGLGVEIAFIIAAALVMSSYNTYKIARKFEEYVKGHSEILSEKCNEAIQGNASVQGKVKERMAVELAL